MKLLLKQQPFIQENICISSIELFKDEDPKINLLKL